MEIGMLGFLCYKVRILKIPTNYKVELYTHSDQLPKHKNEEIIHKNTNSLVTRPQNFHSM